YTLSTSGQIFSALLSVVSNTLCIVSPNNRHTVWIYLFFLPFQLVTQFQYYTIPGVAIAAFIYLGFLAAGEEIEQPFGYDHNDLDLDLFCHSIIHNELKQLRTTPCLNAYFGPESKPLQQPVEGRHHPVRTLTDIATEQLELRENEGQATGLRD
ncbi:Bestrophin, RFP-TM, chloride channel-domain-containing protein, partial [Gymnopilus junonius]